MTTHTPTGRWTHRLGWGAGRVWRWLARRDRQAQDWLVTHGLPMGTAKAMLWAIKFVVLAVLFYAVTWLALLLVFVLVASWAVRSGERGDEEDSPEWRMGLSGYGLYRGDIRIDPGSEEDD